MKIKIPKFPRMKNPIQTKLEEIEKMYRQNKYIPDSDFAEFKRIIDNWCKERAPELN